MGFMDLELRLDLYFCIFIGFVILCKISALVFSAKFCFLHIKEKQTNKNELFVPFCCCIFWMKALSILKKVFDLVCLYVYIM